MYDNRIFVKYILPNRFLALQPSRNHDVETAQRIEQDAGTPALRVKDGVSGSAAIAVMQAANGKQMTFAESLSGLQHTHVARVPVFCRF